MLCVLTQWALLSTWRLTRTPRAKQRGKPSRAPRFPTPREICPPTATSDRRAPTRECTTPAALLTRLPPKLSWKKIPSPSTSKPEVSYEISAPKRAEGVGTLNGPFLPVAVLTSAFLGDHHESGGSAFLSIHAANATRLAKDLTAVRLYLLLVPRGQ